MPTKRSSAQWQGGLRTGNGTYALGPGGAQVSYGFATRFETDTGTSPEELLAASHAACYSMALAAGLERGGTPATSVRTTAACTIEKVGEGFKVTRMLLTTRAKVPGIAKDAFAKAATAAKDGCPISGALKGNVQIELDAALE
jgi:lipoyl-dependent peroxiredoxin